MNRKEYKTFDAFLEAIRRAGVAQVVERVVQEIRPRAGQGTSVVVEQVHWVEFVAYRRGVIFRCQVDGVLQAGCERKLDESGIPVKMVSGNIT